MFSSVGWVFHRFPRYAIEGINKEVTPLLQQKKGDTPIALKPQVTALGEKLQTPIE